MDDAATPDELLLELMDLVQLAFPAAIDQMIITFVDNADGKRPALSNLDARGPINAPRRPALGHDDNQVLDAINHLLAELADATERAGGMRAQAGQITVRTGADGDRVVQLLGAGGDRMERRFDKSELRWLLFTGPLFAALNDTEAQELALLERTRAQLLGTSRFNIDMQKGIIHFSTPREQSRSFRFELLGSRVDEHDRFLWGWANDAAPPQLTRRVDTVRQRSVGDGLRSMTEAAFSLPLVGATRLAQHAAVAMQAQGIYQAPFTGRAAELGGKASGHMWLALFEQA
jgi:hypothetical protein